MRGSKSYGFTLILTSLMMSFILAVLGVLADAALLASARERLREAVDGAATAASQAMEGVSTVAAAEGKAKAAALAVAKSRFQDGLLGLEQERIDLNVWCRPARQPNGRPSGVVDVHVQTELPAPVYFMRLWGVAGVPVSDESHCSRRNRNTILVLIGQHAASAELRGQVAEMAATLSPYDTVRVVPALGGLAAALAAGYQEVREIDQPDGVNGIVLISTSGAPMSMDPGARRAMDQILSDNRYRIRLGTMQWVAGVPLAAQLANSPNLPRPQ